MNSASLAIAPERGVRDKNVSRPRKTLVKHNRTGTFHSFCSVLTVCLGNENEKKNREVVRESNTDLTLNKLRMCRPKKWIWDFGTVPYN